MSKSWKICKIWNGASGHTGLLEKVDDGSYGALKKWLISYCMLRTEELWRREFWNWLLTSVTFETWRTGRNTLIDLFKWWHYVGLTKWPFLVFAFITGSNSYLLCFPLTLMWNALPNRANIITEPECFLAVALAFLVNKECTAAGWWIAFQKRITFLHLGYLVH